MPNTIKYSTGSESLALKKGNFYIGTGDVPKGPTSSTGYYNGISPPAGGYTVYLNKESNGPSIYVATNDAQLIDFTNKIAGTSFTTATQCLNYYATQTDKMVFNRDYEGIITNGLVLNLDAGFTPSYSTSGVTWYDVSNGGNNGTLTNGPTFNSSNGGNIVFDSTDDYGTVSYNSNLDLINTVSLQTWVKYTTTSNTILIEKSNNNTHYQLQIFDSNQGTPGIAGQLVFMLQPNESNWVTSGVVTNDGNWHHVVGTYNRTSTTSIIYIDGVLTNTNSSITTGPTSNAQPLLIGSRSGVGGFGGSIANILIYNRVLSASEVLQNYNAQKSRFVTSFDPDAQAFITAAGITNPTQQDAINTLVVSLKSNGIWTKMRAIYPFVGGTSTTHKFNLKDPRDLDAAYRLVFNGGITHSNTGALPNGTNGYADTYVNTSVANFPTTNYISMGYYSRTGGSHSTGGNVMGSFGSPTAQSTSARMLIRFVGNPNSSLSAFNYVDGVLPNASTTTDTIGTGMYIGTRSSTASKLFVRGSLVGNNNSGNTAFSLPPYNAFLFAYNNRNAGALNYTNKECAFAHIGVGLTDSECTNLTTIVNTFQTTLGRNV